MAFTRKSIADHLDSYDAEISALQDSKRETLDDYRVQLAEKGFAKAQIKAEVEALKRAMRRRRAIAKTSEAEVEEADDLADEIFVEITSPAPRATRTREATQSYAEVKGRDRTQTQEQPETVAFDNDGALSATVPYSTIEVSPTPSSAPRMAADDEAAQTQSSSAPIQSAAVSPSGAVKAPEADSLPASGAPFNNPKCKNPFGCSHAHDRGSCNDCFFAWAKLPLDEQRRLLAEAMEAAEREMA
ncbi:MAG: hypothetical protein ACTHJQ_01475 [Rhizobiaceae bacterium]